jgi:hypothetical protein
MRKTQATEGVRDELQADEADGFAWSVANVSCIIVALVVVAAWRTNCRCFLHWQNTRWSKSRVPVPWLSCEQ